MRYSFKLSYNKLDNFNIIFNINKMNKIKEIILKFCYVLGIIFVFTGISILEYTTFNKHFGLISCALGTFLCFIYHFILYKINMNKKYFIHIIIIVICIFIAFIFIWIKYFI